MRMAPESVQEPVCKRRNVPKTVTSVQPKSTAGSQTRGAGRGRVASSGRLLWIQYRGENLGGELHQGDDALVVHPRWSNDPHGPQRTVRRTVGCGHQRHVATGREIALMADEDLHLPGTLHPVQEGDQPGLLLQGAEEALHPLDVGKLRGIEEAP